MKNLNPFQIDKNGKIEGDNVKDFRPVPQQTESPPELADVEIVPDESIPSSDLTPLAAPSDISPDQLTDPKTPIVAPAKPMSPEQAP